LLLKLFHLYFIKYQCNKKNCECN